MIFAFLFSKTSGNLCFFFSCFAFIFFTFVRLREYCLFLISRVFFLIFAFLTSKASGILFVFCFCVFFQVFCFLHFQDFWNMFFWFGFFELFLTFFCCIPIESFQKDVCFFIVFGDSLFCKYCDAM